MLALTGNSGLTHIVSSTELTVFATTQSELEVMTQITLSLFTGVNENVGELVPAAAPFNFHWYAGSVPPFTGVAV